MANALPLGWSEDFIFPPSARMSPAPALPLLRESMAEPIPTSMVLFSGVPSFEDGQAILFDSARGAPTLPDRVIFSRLTVRFPGRTPDPKRLDPGLSLLIFVDDLVVPRARVRLADLVRQGGERPLNLMKQPGQVVRIVLVDPAGVWISGAPVIEVEVS